MSGGVLLSFTGVDHAVGGIDVQKPEFYGAGKGFDNVIFINDLTRSWGNALDYDLILETIAPLVQGRKIFTTSNSPG